MKIAIIGDSHFDERSRFAECIRLHDWIAEDARARGVDVVLHAGDVFERKSSPAERNRFADWVTKCATFAPVVIVRGNHDVLDDLLIFGELEAAHPVIVEQAAGVHVVKAGASSLAVACLAWPQKAQLAVSGILEEADDGARTALRAVIAGMRDAVEAHAGPSLLLSHAMVRGSVTSVGQPMIGCAMEIGQEDLALAGTDFVALGHIHAPQDWAFSGVPIAYTGSPRRTTFGEVEDKGYLLVEFDGAELVGWERIIVPATQMVDVAVAVLEDGSFDVEPHLPVDGAEVRIRVRGVASQRDAIRAATNAMTERLTGLGAVSIKAEEHLAAEVRARAPEVAAASTLKDKALAHWASKGMTIPDARRAGALSRLIALEGAAL